ncbi:hypothetical protein ACFL2A_02765 [Thermodesulfobacteriota bacterium]
MKPSKHRERYTNKDVSDLKKLANQNVSTEDIAKRMGRTLFAIQSEASELGISLNPPDKIKKR